MIKRTLSNQSKPRNNDKIKVLIYADSPTAATGFATVCRNISEALYNTGRYDIDILGINYWGDPHNFPYRIWPTAINAERDPYGRKKCANMINQMDYDILFLMQDTFILDFMPELIPSMKRDGKLFRSIVYYPVDGEPKSQWIHNVNASDYLVAYSKFGAEASKRVCPPCKEPFVIPHGANVTDYKPLDKEVVSQFKKMYFGKHADKFIVTNINRNQHRKDIPRTIAAFKEFRKKVPESILYLHMAAKDQGWDLHEVIKSFGFSNTEDVLFPENFGPNQGYPREVVNLIYNSSDLLVSTTLGEGFGLSWAEAMATKTPVLMPNNTVMPEFISEDRGYLCKSGTTPTLRTVLPHDNEVIRPLVDIEDMADKMVYIHDHYEEAMEKAENAYKWVNTELNWQGNIGKQWVDMFDFAYKELQNEKNKVTPKDVDKYIKTESF